MERIDDLQLNGLKIIQNDNGFYFGIDAVLLSSFANIKRNDVVVDFGCATGILPILLSAKTEAKKIYGIEINELAYKTAIRNIKMNNLEDLIYIFNDDIKYASNINELKNQKIDVIISNPPYMKVDACIKSSDYTNLLARYEVECTFEDIVREANKLLKANGRIYIIHKSERFVELQNTLLKYKIMPKRVRFIHSYVNKNSSMVMIEAIKSSKYGVIIEKPLIIYKDINVYTEEVLEIYGK